LQNAPSSRPAASDICDELESYIKNFEKESASKVKKCKQDKLSLLWSLQKIEAQLEKKEKLIGEINLEKSRKDFLTKKEEYIAALEAKLQANQTELDQTKITYFSLEREKESLKRELAKQDDINKQLTATYTAQVKRLRNDVKAKKEEIKTADMRFSDLQKEVYSLEIRLKDEALSLSLEKHKVTDLDNQLQQITKVADNYKQELATVNNTLEKQEGKYKTEIDQLESESGKRLKIATDESAEKEGVITQLNKKLEEMEYKLNKAIESLSRNEDYRLKYTELCKKYEESKQETKKRQQQEGHLK